MIINSIQLERKLMKTIKLTDDQLYELYQKIYAIVEFAEFEIDDEDLRTVTDAVIEDLELDERFYHKPVAPKV